MWMVTTLSSLGGDGTKHFERGKLHASYELQEVVGGGGFGIVRRARRRDGCGQWRAVKSLRKLEDKDLPEEVKTLPERLRAAKRHDAESLLREIKLMKLLDHKNIITLIECFQDSSHVHLVMDMCTGRDLLSFLLKGCDGHTEHDAATVMRQVLAAVEHMHGRRVCHRDLKPENLMMVSRLPFETNTLKVVDFGISVMFEPGQELRDQVGSIHYVAPQVLSGRYNHSCDLWSCGALMYLLLCGYPPFLAESEEKELALVKRGNYAFKAADAPTISEEAKELVRELLRMSQAERISAENALLHVWLNWSYEKNSAGRLLTEARQNLKEWRYGKPNAWDTLGTLFTDALQGTSPSQRNASAVPCPGSKASTICGGLWGADIDMDEGDDCAVQTLGNSPGLCILNCISCKDRGRYSDIPMLFLPQSDHETS